MSSTLNRDVANFGKKHLFDGCEDTCWNSHQGSPQIITLLFDEAVAVSSFSLTFQGGFVGKECTVSVGSAVEDTAWRLALRFFPKDSNAEQCFLIPEEALPEPVQAFRITFGASTDLYGRITLYSLNVFGQLKSES